MEIKEHKLRDYQVDAINKIDEALKNKLQRGAIIMPPGTGKTAVLINVISRLVNQGLNSQHFLVIVPLKQLESQLTHEVNERLFQITDRVKVVTQQSILTKVSAYNNWLEKAIVFTYDFLPEQLSIDNVDKKPLCIYSFLSTPLSISNEQVPIIFEYTFENAVNDKISLPVKVSNHRVFNGSMEITSQLVEVIEYVESTPSAKVLITCKSTSEAKNVSLSLERRLGGSKVVEITSKHPQQRINWAVNEFKDDKTLQVAVVVNMLLTGFDMPNLTDLVILRRLKSHLLFQAIARVTRISKDKDYGRVWDMGGNDIKHLLSETEYVHNEDKIFEPSDSNLSEPVQIIQKRIRPLGDKPTNNDLLNRQRLVHVLKGIIESSESFRPLNIGLFGKWGTGKSTVIELLKHSYKDNDQYNLITFNAWDNEHCDHMVSALSNQISKDVYFDRSIFKKIWFVIIDRFILRKNEWSYLLVITFISSLITFICTNIEADKSFTEWFSANGFISNGSGLLALASASIVGFRSVFKNPLTNKISDLIYGKRYKQASGVAQELKESIEALINAYTYRIGSDKPEIILVIDDLDRCAKNKIIQTIEAVRLLVDLPNVIIIYAVDKQVLLNAVSSKFEDLKDLKKQNKVGRDFLGKLFQLVVELEKPNKELIANFVKSKLYKNNGGEVVPNVQLGQELRDNSSKLNPFSETTATYDAAENYDYELEDYEEDESYLEPEENEASFFSLFTGLFNIDNPRTLVRLHNTLTILKGLYPSCLNDEEVFKGYIFFIFLYEWLSQSEYTDFNFIMDKFVKGNVAEDSELADIYSYYSGEINLLPHDISAMTYRVSRLSLPIGN